MRLRSIGNLDLDFEIRISDFPIKREIQKRISPLRNPSPGWISIKKSKSGFHGFPCKTILVSSGLLFTNYAYACKTAVLKDSFSSPWKEIQKQIFQGSNPFSDFAFECKFEIQILKSKTRFPNRTAFTVFHHYFRDNASYSDTCEEVFLNEVL